MNDDFTGRGPTIGEVQSGACSKCGAPTYVPGAWWSVVPPNPRRTCTCPIPAYLQLITRTSTGTNWNSGGN